MKMFIPRENEVREQMPVPYDNVIIYDSLRVAILKFLFLYILVTHNPHNAFNHVQTHATLLPAMLQSCSVSFNMTVQPLTQRCCHKSEVALCSITFNAFQTKMWCSNLGKFGASTENYLKNGFFFLVEWDPVSENSFCSL